MNEPRDVHSSLAEMDRKLRELQRELAMVAPAARRHSESEPAAPAAPTSEFRARAAYTPRPAAPPQPAYQAGAGPAPPPVAPGLTGASAPSPPFSAPAFGAPAGDIADTRWAEHRPQELATDTRETAARIVREAASRVAAMGGQIEELQRLRDELQRCVRELAAEYEREASPGSPAPAQPTPLTPIAEPPPLPAIHPVEPHAGYAGPTVDTADLWDGSIAMNAGPFTDINSLCAFERALGELPAVEDVHIRRFEVDRVVFELRLAGPTSLVDDMQRLLPVPFELLEAGDGKLAVLLQEMPSWRTQRETPREDA